MRNHEIEAWALRIIDDVSNGRPNEDSRVELKKEWLTDHWKAARHIAGHCNAARGEHVLWLIGVDQKSGIVGSDHAELANWFAQVDACFDGLAPRRVDLNISINNVVIVAILFETDRVPFVVKNQKGGEISAEVPWRENTRTRSASRADLLQVLTPLQRQPQVEVLGAMLQSNFAGRAGLNLSVNLYVTSNDMEQIVIPYHRCGATVAFEGTVEPIQFKGVGFVIATDSINRATNTEAIIKGSGHAMVKAATDTPSPTGANEVGAAVEITLMPTGAVKPIVLQIVFPSDKIRGVWEVGDAPKTRREVSYAKMYEEARRGRS